jgi:branched-chain amino acid aminotransferase
MTHNYQRQLSQVKTIDYLMAIHLQPKLKSAGADDILYHDNGFLRECPRANFFLVTGDHKVVTPANNILKGITRMRLLDPGKSALLIEEREISINEIYSAKEAFITSSTKQVLPVRQIDDHVFASSYAVANTLNDKLSEAILQYSNAVGAE